MMITQTLVRPIRQIDRNTRYLKAITTHEMFSLVVDILSRGDRVKPFEI